VSVFDALDEPIGAKTLPLKATDGFEVSGPVATFHAEYVDIADLRAVIQWGDDTTTTILGSEVGGIVDNGDGTFTIHASHNYTSDAEQPIAVSVFQSVEREANALTLPLTTRAGVEVFGQVAVFFAPQREPADFVATIEWGDGTISTVLGSEGGIVQLADGEFAVRAGHLFESDPYQQFRVTVAEVTSKPWNYNVVVTLLDNGGLTAEESFVYFSRPIITGITPPVSPQEGVPFTVPVATFTAGGAPSDFNATIQWGDATTTTVLGSEGAVVPNADGSFTVFASHTYADDATDLAFTVTITDVRNGGEAEASGLVASVENVAPAASISRPTDGFDGLRNQERTFVLYANDPSPIDQAAGFTFVINWGDGSAPQTVVGVSGTTVTRTFVNAGEYNIGVTATDKDGGTSSQYTMTLPIHVAEQQGSTLTVMGTSGADTILLRPSGPDSVLVTVNGVNSGTFTPTGDIVVHGLEGDDLIDLGSGINRPAWLYGGDGSDRYIVSFNGNGSTRRVNIVDTSGSNMLSLQGPASATSFTVTPNVTTAGGETVDYTGAILTAFDVTGGTGTGNTFTLNETRPSTVTTLDGGPSANDSVTATFAQAFNGVLNLLGFEQATMAVGGDLAGTLTVAGTLNHVSVSGGTPGKIVANKIGTIQTAAAYGPLVLQVNEGGIQRRVELATPDNPYPLPAPGAPSRSGVTMRYLYEGTATGLAHPQLTARINNTSGNTAPFQYDVSLVTWNDVAKLNLARLDADGPSGVRSVAIEGDLLTSVTTTAANWFGSGTTGGVRLPQDDLAGVAIRDLAPHYAIAARSVQAVAFGSHRKDDGKIELGNDTSRGEARKLLASGTALVQASNTFRVPFANPQEVVFFYVESTGGGSFTDKPLLFSVQDVVTAVDQLDITKGNRTHKSNAERGAVTGLVTVVPMFDHDGNRKEAQVLGIDLRGDGGSIYANQSLPNFYTTKALMDQYADAVNSTSLFRTASQTKTKIDDLYTITPRITSTGPLGDVRARTTANIMATSMFGTLDLDGGPLSGMFQTTGVHVDPITGVTTYENPGDVGRLFVTYDSKGNGFFATTFVRAGGSGLTGQMLVRGDLISQVAVSGGISGLLAIEGNVGVGVIEGATVKRLGGILSSSGELSGQIIVFDSVEGGRTKKKGKVIGDIFIAGGIRNGGRLAVQGDIDSLIVNGRIDSSSAMVVGGSINSLVVGDVEGIMAVNGAIDSLKIGKTDKAQFYGQKLADSVQPSPSAAAVDAVFLRDQIDGGVSSFDDNDLDLFYLSLVRDRLNRLSASNGQLSM
jgi:hypothetical protein